MLVVVDEIELARIALSFHFDIGLVVYEPT